MRLGSALCFGDCMLSSLFCGAQPSFFFVACVVQEARSQLLRRHLMHTVAIYKQSKPAPDPMSPRHNDAAKIKQSHFTSRMKIGCVHHQPCRTKRTAVQHEDSKKTLQSSHPLPHETNFPSLPIKSTSLRLMLSIQWLKRESMVQTIVNGSMRVGLSPMRDPGCRQTTLQARKSTSKPNGNKGSQSRAICLKLKSIQLKCYMVFRRQNGTYSTKNSQYSDKILYIRKKMAGLCIR